MTSRPPRKVDSAKRLTPVSWWTRLGKVTEHVYPWFFGLSVGVGMWVWQPATAATARALERFLSGSIDAAAVLAGFQMTALTLLLSIADKPIVKQLRELDFYDRLIGFHYAAISSLLSWLVLSLVLLAIQGGTADQSNAVADLGNATHWTAVVLTAVSTAALFASFRVMHLMVKLLKASSKNDERPK